MHLGTKNTHQLTGKKNRRVCDDHKSHCTNLQDEMSLTLIEFSHGRLTAFRLRSSVITGWCHQKFKKSRSVTCALLTGSQFMSARRSGASQVKYRARSRGGGGEVYPHTANVLAAAGLPPIRHHIDKRRITVYKNIQSQPILLGCTGAEQQEGTAITLIGGSRPWTI